ncbi:DUF4279 domain-containing protein [Pendulispora albinea]|uniref:DUF4279 domain-containing protein n=1 Tax=Pendulispora albinea TaxID=2741071 RepID=A0ABZ2M097_9BACT
MPESDRSNAEGCSVALIVSGPHVDPDEITNRVGLEPTFTRRVGDRLPSGNRSIERGLWKLSIDGPTPVGAPKLASELARTLLGRLPTTPEASSQLHRDGDVAMGFVFGLAPLLTFSYELDAAVVQRLAELGASLEFYLLDGSEKPPGRRFGSSDGQYTVEVRIHGKDLDPGDVTRALGLEPTLSRRAGEPSTRGAKRVCPEGVWCFGVVREGLAEMNELARELFDRFPVGSDAWAKLCREHAVEVRFSFIVGTSTGHFDLDTEMVRKLATFGHSLVFSFFDFEE